jgi:ATP-dependent Lon protease
MNQQELKDRQNFMSDTTNTKNFQTLPLLPLKDVVVFPNMIIPLFVGRSMSVEAVKAAKEQYEKKVFLVAQKDSKVDDPADKDLYQMGTVGVVLQMLQLSDGTVKILVEGIQQARWSTIEQ